MCRWTRGEGLKSIRLWQVLTHKLSTFWVFDDQGQPHVVHYGNMRFVGGGGYTRVEKTALGKTVRIGKRSGGKCLGLLQA